MQKMVVNYRLLSIYNCIFIFYFYAFYLCKVSLLIYIYFCNFLCIYISINSQIVSNPDCKHGVNIRKNTEFYVDFLLPRVRAYCQLKGWEQMTISVLREVGLSVAGQDYSLSIYDDASSYLSPDANEDKQESLSECVSGGVGGGGEG